MTNILNIEIIENDKKGHEDLMFVIPNLVSQQKFDTYYFALAIEPKRGISEIKNSVAKLLLSWNKKLSELDNGEVIYLPIDFSDQYTGCIKIKKNKDLNLTYGYSSREGWSVNPINPSDYYNSISDFKSINKKTLKVKQVDFEKCLNILIEKLKMN